MTHQCACIRVSKNPKKLPGEQRVWRCQNPAKRVVRVHQANDHIRVGTGWFAVRVCDWCARRAEEGR